MLYDKDIREPLFWHLEDTYGKCRIFEEVPMAKARADVMMVLPHEIIGIEIKSNADTYDRLAGQVRNYDKFCDRNMVVTGLRHIKHIAKHIPEYWGILCVYSDNGKNIIEQIRPALPNPKIKADFQMSLLWKSELSNILNKNSMPKYAGKSKAFIRSKLLEKVDMATLKQQMCHELFERDYTLI